MCHLCLPGKRKKREKGKPYPLWHLLPSEDTSPVMCGLLAGMGSQQAGIWVTAKDGQWWEQALQELQSSFPPFPTPLLLPSRTRAPL